MHVSRVTVMGLGHFGGGVGIARYFAEHGAKVVVTDFQPAEKLRESIEQVRDLADAGTVTLRLGEHVERDFVETDLVIANPAVALPWKNKFLRAAAIANVPITTEFNIAVSQLASRDRVIAITGTAGKSTTSAMVAHVLREVGRRVVFAGNIGGSTIASLRNVPSDAFVVLEVSSFMLYWLSGMAERDGFVPPEWCQPSRMKGWPARVAAITNISDNHLDWHGGMEHYRECKRQIFAGMTSKDTVVVSDRSDASGFVEKSNSPRCVVLGASELVENLAIPGVHNQRNARMAVEICLAADSEMKREVAERAVRTFAGLSHRLELVGEMKVGVGSQVGGAKAFNDSKSTTPQATVLAVEAFEAGGGTSRVHLIAGGYDKKSDLSPIAALATKVAGLYTIGATGEAIASGATAAGGSAVNCGSLANAILEIKRRVKPGDVVLLSPGCASWDQYENYERRGEEFRALVRGEKIGGGR
ncbi:MAG: UDP-N-acetylmuramoyl-L-alanine--D-glutamate ligase [Phycisphaerales bacterium]